MSSHDVSFTHLYNAMSDNNHRNPGVLSAALNNGKFAEIICDLNHFNAFDLIYAIKNIYAGPEFSTDLMGTFFYRTFFGYQHQLGNPTMGATVASTTFGIILIGVMIYLFAFQKRITRYQY